MLQTLEREVAQAEALLEALQIPEGRLAGQEWHRLSLAERIQVLHERMLHHLHQAQAAAADQGRPMVVQAADARHAAGALREDELAEVHALLDEYGVPRVRCSVFDPDWRAQHVPARAAERLRILHRLMAESGLPDFMPPGTVLDPPEAKPEAEVAR